MKSLPEKELKFFENDRFARQIGIKLLEAGPGMAKAEMEITENHLNAANVVHGGAVFSLADFTFAVASNSHGHIALSINSNIQFIRSTAKGKIIAIAKEISLSKKLGHYSIEVQDETQNTIAVMTGMVYRKNAIIPSLSTSS